MYGRVATLFVPNYKTPVSDGSHQVLSLASELSDTDGSYGSIFCGL